MQIKLTSVRRRPKAASGAKHLYLIDFDPTNLPNLKSTIENTYPDVKVPDQPTPSFPMY